VWERLLCRCIIETETCFGKRNGSEARAGPDGPRFHRDIIESKTCERRDGTDLKVLIASISTCIIDLSWSKIKDHLWGITNHNAITKHPTVPIPNYS
jgi:hypothetical protein